MSLTTDDFAPYTRDPDADPDKPLGDALAELAVDVDIDSVDAVRELREDV
ncbi:hypothetical protein [Natronomonas sp. EA1]